MIFFGIMHRKIRMPERHTGGRPERAGISWHYLAGCMACRTGGYDLTDRSWDPASVPAANYQSRLQARPVCHSIHGADPATRPAVPPGGIRDGVANCTTTTSQTYGGSRIPRPTLRRGANRRLGPWWRTCTHSTPRLFGKHDLGTSPNPRVSAMPGDQWGVADCMAVIRIRTCMA